MSDYRVQPILRLPTVTTTITNFRPFLKDAKAVVDAVRNPLQTARMGWESAKGAYQVTKNRIANQFEGGAAATVKRIWEFTKDRLNPFSSKNPHADFVFEHPFTSGVVPKTNPKKTTTLLWSYKADWEKASKEMVEAGLHRKYGEEIGETMANYAYKGNRGGYNILDTTEEIVKEGTKAGGFFEAMNVPWMKAAIRRGDNVTLLSDTNKYLREVRKGREVATGFGKEIDFFKQYGYKVSSNRQHLVAPTSFGTYLRGGLASAPIAIHFAGWNR